MIVKVKSRQQLGKSADGVYQLNYCTNQRADIQQVEAVFQSQKLIGKRQLTK